MSRRSTPIQHEELVPGVHCTPEEQRRLLGESPYFHDLTQTQIASIWKRFHQQHYAAEETILYAGDAADRLMVVASGLVKIQRPTPDGHDVVLDIVGAGEHVGSLFDLGDVVNHDHLIAHTEACILWTSAAVFRTILEEYPSVAVASLEQVANRLRNAQRSIEYLSAYPAGYRIIATLLRLADRAGKPHDGGTLIDFPLSRQDLADMTGTQVETVSRVMSDLRKRGLVESGRRWILIPDRATLQQFQECLSAN